MKSPFVVFEKYLKCLNNDRLRITLTRFRCSAHKLLVEEGRYIDMNRTLRTCSFGNLNVYVIEDEYHFVLVCPAYRHLRTPFFSKTLM